ncbi:MAG TPA: SRPBCC family protein [Mucilaginibacter sp.]
MESNTKDRELRITRTLDAPVELVWEVFTKPEHIANWWGPNGFTNTIYTMDVKPGGVWDFVMHGPDGTNYKNKSIYKEIVMNKKIVFNHFNPDFTTTIEFEKQGEQTHISWHMLFDSAEEFIQVVKTFKADEGLKQNIVKLNAYLTGLKK